MSDDDVIEDEANDEIRRIRRARLAANDDWCDGCGGYTHMPYCPAYAVEQGDESQAGGGSGS